MERGEFKRVVESAATQANAMRDMRYFQELYEAQIPGLILQLMGKVCVQAAQGEKWASILGHANVNSRVQLAGLSLAMNKVSDFMQQEGFHTDDAEENWGDVLYKQLTVFWADGKAIYEHELHKLGNVDPKLIQEALII